MFSKLLALGLTALVVIPGGAHLFELRAKMKLSQSEYFTAQSIYAGWAMFSVAIFAAIAANVWLFLMMRYSDPAAAQAAAGSAMLIALTLVIFFVWVFPYNRATDNWTKATADWETLRRNWEYGHAVNAVISFVALLATGRAIMESTGS